MPIFTYRQAAAAENKQGAPVGGDPNQPAGGFNVLRIIIAILVLMLIFVAAVYCAHDTAMKDWSSPLLHTFELLLGGLVGIILGEKTANAH